MSSSPDVHQVKKLCEALIEQCPLMIISSMTNVQTASSFTGDSVIPKNSMEQTLAEKSIETGNQRFAQQSEVSGALKMEM